MKSDKLFFLPFVYKPAGIVLIILGIAWWFIAQHFSIAIKLPVFAVISSFISTKFFSVVETNFSDEIALIVLLLGSIFIVFSKEKLETEEINAIRYNSIFKALLINQIILLLSALFLYGAAFIIIVLINLISFSVIYLILLQLNLRKTKT